MSEGRWLVVGLGNPGPQYAGNRHNVGQMVLDELARRAGASFSSKGGVLSRRPQAATAEVRIGTGPGGVPGPRAVLAKPTTYMNTSGGPVAALARYYDVPPERVVMVHDELDIPFGEIKLKIGGGEGGHNGLRDTTKALGTKDYLRVRVGVGRPPGRMDAADFVLRDFAKPEQKDLPFLLDDAADAVELLVTEGLERAQLRFHTRTS
ncbi:peptidyl-tRNA hydrolase [Cellulomonas hominis]|uniref:Peptidyl-tRNA hydrolase n=1 Tax=Cellulomonas hominis TaxID=156981 RepID=A0A511FDL6_9CELL|nr:aminoacyl-tRNA hydrolase [Cellulomonas hominis]MBB5472007.1 PTH1 family peptidyl-tRNA hydrolase [Cellulomonas hominis]NKY08388.1 aminoacyl-tRNA hydrolase [Cellulomonas hominis]GEL47272.1 peptidyl-tRNA hydrolase [Cellulomonas hominis]